MRSLIVAVTLVSALAFASGAFAQTTGQPEQPSTPATRLARLRASILAGLWSPIPISLVRAALYSRTAALLALAAPYRAGGTSATRVTAKSKAGMTGHSVRSYAISRSARGAEMSGKIVWLESASRSGAYRRPGLLADSGLSLRPLA